MDQGIYPNLDRQVYNQPYGQPYYAAPVDPYNYPAHPQVVVHDNHKHDMHEPLIDKHKHKGKKNTKRIVAAIIAFLGLAIELAVLYHIKNATYLYKYCYWEFGLKEYEKDVDQALVVADYPNFNYVENFYGDLKCSNNSNPFPECPELCTFANRLNDLHHSHYIHVFKLAEATMGLLIVLYIVSLLCKKPKMKKPLVSVLGILSFTVFLCTVLYSGHTLRVLDIPEVNEDIHANKKGYDEPNDIELAHGGNSLIAIMGFMLVYRIVLIVLAK